MPNKLLKIAFIGKTNSGKSTLINKLVGEEISIINKKINTTQEYIIGIRNLKDTQIIFYDTPGSNFLKTDNLTQKKLKINIWQAIDSVDLLAYLVDSSKYNFNIIQKDLIKLSEVKKNIIFLFNKIDLVKNKNILPFINELKNLKNVNDFFLISGKYNKGVKEFLDFLTKKSILSEWLYKKNEITNKDDIFITNECTRNAFLYFLHQEIPYNINVLNHSYKYLKNNDLKIKQIIEFNNRRYKQIILGKNGSNIKRIRQKSQVEIENILKCKVHLYLQIIFKNEN